MFKCLLKKKNSHLYNIACKFKPQLYCNYKLITIKLVLLSIFINKFNIMFNLLLWLICFRWEKDNAYCNDVKKNFDFERILDFVDIAIFDFIIGNGDRHRYEVVEQFNTILLIDNGKRYTFQVPNFFKLLRL